MLSDVLEFLFEAVGGVREALRGPRFIHSRFRLIDGAAGGMVRGEEIAAEAIVDHRSITLGDLELRGVAVSSQSLRISYLDDIDQRAQVVRVEFDGGAGEWTIPASVDRRRLRKRIGASL
ncbi:hypothetical protein [Microbacterium sp. NPDC079995]|uniref:hypothetical protein n=1 Tax=unclassified Microbacterium TaxID=2609290 RepID=UPI003450E51C